MERDMSRLDFTTKDCKTGKVLRISKYIQEKYQKCVRILTKLGITYE